MEISVGRKTPSPLRGTSPKVEVILAPPPIPPPGGGGGGGGGQKDRGRVNKVK
jgi:hypothetical protein